MKSKKPRQANPLAPSCAFQRLRNVLALVGLLTSLASAQPALNKPPAEIAREQSKAVVLLEPLDERGRVLGQGSGFLVSPNGAIVTNLHVIQGAISVRVKLSAGDVYQTADVVDFDSLKDIAVIKIRGFQLPAVRLGDSDRSVIGESIVAISSPEGLTNSLTTGVISGIRRLETHRVFQITAPIGEGSSGGALFDSEGFVIGITTYILRSGQNINFALPINYVRGMISDRVTTTLASLPSPASRATAMAPASTESERPASTTLEADIDPASKRRLGRTAREPMFSRSDEAFALFFRIVDGIGRYRYEDLEEVTMTATPVKTLDTATKAQYTIKYLSFHQGVAMNFGKPDGLLQTVDLLVNWSVDDLERTYGDKYKKSTVDGEPAFEFKKSKDKKQMHALLDADGNIRAVRFSKVK